MMVGELGELGRMLARANWRPASKMETLRGLQGVTPATLPRHSSGKRASVQFYGDAPPVKLPCQAADFVNLCVMHSM